MKLPTVSHFLYMLLIILFQLPTMLQSHGFCAHTAIKQYDTAKGCSIISVCKKAAKHKKICISSYDPRAHTHTPRRKVKMGGQSSVPWYVQFSCTPACPDANKNDVAC
jgi:hypothetical protein